MDNSPVISAFDLLYDEYGKSLEKPNTRLNPKDSEHKPEQIAAFLFIIFYRTLHWHRTGSKQACLLPIQGRYM
jgi:hypothetical protein